MSFNYEKNNFRSRSSSRPAVKKARLDPESGHVRSSGTAPRDASGVRDPEERKRLRKTQKKMQKKVFASGGKAGESDRHIQVKRPKHLFAGKRGIGKADRR